MKAKIVVITGANSGIGKSATIKFASEGHTVIMACRNLEKSRKVQQEIIDSTKNNNVDLIKLDVSSFESISEFCTDFKKKYDHLDILIHNAAYINHGIKNYQLSLDNIELSFATNAVGPFLMTELLKDRLEKSNDPRILHACTTNIRYFFDNKRKIEFDNLLGEFKDRRPYNTYKMYGDSKMALLLLTFKLAEVYKKDGIKVNAIQIPAIKISKETIKKLKASWRVAARIQNIFSSSRESMANTYYHICISKDFNNITGKLIDDKREIVQSTHYEKGFIQDIKQFFDKKVYPKYADDKINSDKVWDFCVNLTKCKLENKNRITCAKGENVSLEFAHIEDRNLIYEMLVSNEISHHMFNEIHQAPTWEEFSDESIEYYSGMPNNVGSYLLIKMKDDIIGSICYSLNKGRKRWAELDIWISSNKNTGKGHGVEAIKLLMNYINSYYHIKSFLIRPWIKNTNAIKAYKKCGFKETESFDILDYYCEEDAIKYGEGDYGNETINLIYNMS